MSPLGRVLAVDDTPASLKLLTMLLKEAGYEVRATTDGEMAIGAALEEPPELILLDIRMPNIDGFEVCRQLKQHSVTTNIPVIFLTAIADTADKVKGFELGAVDFVTKPYQREELLQRVQLHLKVSRLSNHLEDLVELRTQALQASQQQLYTSMADFVAAIATVVEIRDPYTSGHQQRVAKLARAIADYLQWPESQRQAVYLASIVHDIGKIKIPAEILCKPGQISKLEWEMIKQHAEVGFEILKGISFPWPVAQIVYQHHERLDGAGYPQGLTAEQILPEAKVLAVADVVDAMVSHRPYRPGLGLERALAEIRAGRELKYDADAVDACVSLFESGAFSFEDRVA